jgi:amino acid adenylation domain-containing protein
MTIQEKIKELYTRGIAVSLDGEELVINSNYAIQEEDIFWLRENKQSIIQYFKDLLLGYEPIEQVQTGIEFSLSAAQKRLWVLSKFENTANVYSIYENYRIEGSLNETAFTSAYQNLLTRHEVLRTVFTEDAEGNPRQRILAPTDKLSNIQIEDYSTLRKEEREGKIESYVQQAISSGFDLEQGPLIRCSLLKERENSYVWVLVMHHIVSDGWSMGVLHREFSELYNAAVEGRTPELSPLSIQYKDYAAWHNAQLQSEAINPHKEYWLEQFSGELPVLELPSDKPRPKVMTYNGASVYRELDKQTTDSLKAFSQRQGGTLFMTLQTALNILLHKYTGQEDIVIGSPIAGREHPDLEGQIGFYVNTLALRTQFSKEDSITTLYQKIKENTLGAYSHQVYPYDELVDALKLTRDMSRNPLFEVMLVVQSRDESETGLGFTDTKIRPYHSTSESYEVAKFDMSFGFEEHSEGMYYSLNYNTDIYSDEQVKRMLSHLEQLLNTISTQTQTSLTNYELLTQEEKIYLLETLNDTKADYPKDKTIVDLFEEQVSKTPDNIAIKFRDTELTYRELNEKSNQLAHYLITHYNIQSDDLIGIELERSEWMVIGILAIIKSGGAYVPINPEYPEQRKGFIKEDADLKLIITVQELHKFIEANKSKEYPSTNPNIKLSPNNLIYVIYTSGTTGNPKGVLIEHKNVVRLVYNPNYVEINSDDSLLQTGAIEFDASTFEILGMLTNGAQINLLSKEVILDLNSFKDYLAMNDISIMWFTASFFDSLVIQDISVLSSLKKIIVGGSVLNPKWIQKVREAFPYLIIINGYGPTENTTFSLTYQINAAESNIPIGRPINNSSIYIFNNDFQLQPIGAIGELYVGGLGVARGYLNRPELTQEKFITNPYKPEERLYRTGDLGRWREDGNLEYLGRIDDQVKIRGYRIELGEIEQTLSSHPNIKQAVVIARPLNNSADKELIAYTTGAATAEELKAYLKEKLPSYMVPSYYVKLESIPLTSNGKVDRKALPDPEGTGLNQGEYAAPRTETEKQLVKLWSEVLGVEEATLSIKADFFDLGGHSIKAIRLLGQIHKQLGVKLSLKELFANPSVEQLSRLITSTTGQEAYTSITPLEEQSDYAVSSSQRRLWVLSRFEGASEAYNIPQVVRLEGEVNEAAFGIAYQDLLTRHEVLRTVFIEDKEGNPRQRILASTDKLFTIQIEDYSPLPKEERPARLNEYVQQAISSGFDLEQGPLIRCSLLKETSSSYVWVLVMHHIVSDGWSMGVLHSEFSELYNAAVEARTPDLSPLSIQYKDYAAWHNAQLQSESINSHKEYWLEQFNGELPVLELPSDKPRPKVMTYNGSSVYRELDKQTTDKLKAFSQQQGGTLFMTLQTALNILLHKYTGQEDIVIGSPIAGREHPDLEGQIGFYVNTLSLRNQFSKEDTITTLYQKIKENT